jgi:hypothetical protein
MRVLNPQVLCFFLFPPWLRTVRSLSPLPFTFLPRTQEKTRQLTSLELIASENFTSGAVMECLGSVLTNKVRRRSLLRGYWE